MSNGDPWSHEVTRNALNLLATREAIASVSLDPSAETVYSDYHSLALALEQAQRENRILEEKVTQQRLTIRQLEQKIASQREALAKVNAWAAGNIGTVMKQKIARLEATIAELGLTTGEERGDE